MKPTDGTEGVVYAVPDMPKNCSRAELVSALDVAVRNVRKQHAGDDDEWVYTPLSEHSPTDMLDDEFAMHPLPKPPTLLLPELSEVSLATNRQSGSHESHTTSIGSTSTSIDELLCGDISGELQDLHVPLTATLMSGFTQPTIKTEAFTLDPSCFPDSLIFGDQSPYPTFPNLQRPTKQSSITAKQISANDKQVLVIDKQIPIDNKQVPVNNKQISTGNKQTLLDNKQISDNIKQTLVANKQVLASAKEALPIEMKNRTLFRRRAVRDLKHLTKSEAPNLQLDVPIFSPINLTSPKWKWSKEEATPRPHPECLRPGRLRPDKPLPPKPVSPQLPVTTLMFSKDRRPTIKAYTPWVSPFSTTLPSLPSSISSDLLMEIESELDDALALFDHHDEVKRPQEHRPFPPIQPPVPPLRISSRPNGAKELSRKRTVTFKDRLVDASRSGILAAAEEAETSVSELRWFHSRS